MFLLQMSASWMNYSWKKAIVSKHMLRKNMNVLTGA